MASRRASVWVVVAGALAPACIQPSTNIGLPVPQGHTAVRGSAGVTTDDASYTSEYVHGEWDYEQERASSGSEKIQHHLGKVHSVGWPSTLGLRFGVSRRNDLGIEFGWGHAGINTRVDLMPPEGAAHLVLTGDLRLTVNLNPSAASRLVAFLPIYDGSWRYSTLVGLGASGGAFGYTTWHSYAKIPVAARMDRHELRAEAVLGFALNERADARQAELVLLFLPYWVVAENAIGSASALRTGDGTTPPKEVFAGDFEFTHDRGALLALSLTLSIATK